MAAECKRAHQGCPSDRGGKARRNGQTNDQRRFRAPRSKYAQLRFVSDVTSASPSTWRKSADTDWRARQLRRRHAGCPRTNYGGDPGGIRTRDLDLERVASLARLDDGVSRETGCDKRKRMIAERPRGGKPA